MDVHNKKINLNAVLKAMLNNKLRMHENLAQIK